MSGGKDGPPSSSGNLFAELGLAPEDVDALAQIPESEISIETLPYLIMQLKAKKLIGGWQEIVDSISPIVESIETLPYLIMQLKAKKARPSDSTATKSEGDAPSPAPAPSGRHGSSSSTGHSHPAPQSKPSSSSSFSASKGGGRPLPGATKGHPEMSGGHRGSWPGPPGRRGENIKDMEMRLFPQGKPKLPYSYQVSDYHGDAPRTFPHTCSLCRCKVNSKMTWKDHLYGVRHESSKNSFIRLFPNWDPYHQQGQSSSQYSSDIDRRPPHPLKRPAPRPVPPGLDLMPPKRPYQNGPQKMKTHSAPHPTSIQRVAFRTRVVVTKFPLGSVTVKDLLELAEPFGTVLKHLVFPSKGFLEFGTHHEAQAMVSHFYDKLDFTNKHKIYIYLSPNVQCIQIPGEDPDAKYNTVVFTNLPDDSKDTMDKVLEIVEMFGAVRHSNISGTEAYVKMVERKDARLMVKYYGNRPLKQLGKATHVNLLAEHRDSRHKSEDSKTSTTSSSSSSAAAAAKDKGDCTEKAGEDVRLEEKKGRGGPRGQASQPDAAWAELREEDLDPEEEEEVELGEEEEGEGGMMMENEEEEDDGIPVEDEQGLLEDADHDPEDSTEVTEDTHQEGVEPSERANPEQASGEEDNQEEEMCEFPENLDDFVTLDELDSGTDMTVTNDFQGGKVVLIRPIKGYPPKNALMKLAQPFGKVVHHLFSRYRQEALLQLETPEQVREMVAFYRESKEDAVIHGRPVTICICRTLNEIEVPSGRSVYISNLPMGKFTDVDLLSLARPYGPITAYRINRGPRACYIQFESEECASKMLKKNSRPPKFRGSILTICPCRKPDSTIPWIKVCVPLGREDRKEEENGGEEEKERRGAKRRREEGDVEGVCGDLEVEEQKSDDTEETQPGTPAGLHYIVAGFYCKLCNMFYDDETTAKTEHASSAEHHKNLRQKRKKPNA